MFDAPKRRPLFRKEWGKSFDGWKLRTERAPEGLKQKTRQGEEAVLEWWLQRVPSKQQYSQMGESDQDLGCPHGLDHMLNNPLQSLFPQKTNNFGLVFHFNSLQCLAAAPL